MYWSTLQVFFPNSTNHESNFYAVRFSCVHDNQEGQLMIAGTVKFYNGQRGYGFIQPDNGEKDVFVHATALERAGISSLSEGQKVTFETETDSRSGKIAVSKIEVA